MLCTTVNDDWPNRLADDLDGAFEAFVRAHQNLVFTLARRLTQTHADAEDVAQEALVRAYRALFTYDRDRIRAMRLRPWLARIVLNVQRNRVRNRRREPPLEHEPAAPTAERPDVLAAAHAGARELGRLLARLPDDVRTAIVLRHVIGLPYAEVADALDRPVGTVKAQVHRGLRSLRTQLEAQKEAS